MTETARLTLLIVVGIFIMVNSYSFAGTLLYPGFMLVGGGLISICLLRLTQL